MKGILLNQTDGCIPYLEDIKQDTESIKATLDQNFTGARKRYGFRIKKSEADPAKRVEYIYDAVGMTPLTVNQSTGVCNYGSWGDVWFVKNNYPCMLKADGTEESVFPVSNGAITGSTAKLSTVSGGLNAMSAIPLCWIKRYEQNGYEYVIVAEEQIDDSYHAYAHTDSHGAIKDVFYHAMYKGSYTDIAIDGYSASVPGCGKNVNEAEFDTKHTAANVTRVLRSLANQIPEHYTCSNYEILSAKKNSNRYDIRSWSQQCLIADLVTLITKNDNSQAAIGQGRSSGYVNNDTISNGLLKTGRFNGSTVIANQFFGKSTTTEHMCVFWIEDFWANRWDRVNGIFQDHGTYKIKMTPENGGYNLTGAGYISIPGIITPATGYQVNNYMSDLGRVPLTTGGSDSTYDADYFWTNTGVVCMGLCGGDCNAGSLCGSRSLSLNFLASWSSWHFGASLTLV